MTWRAVFENPRSARQQLEALVWKHTDGRKRYARAADAIRG